MVNKKIPLRMCIACKESKPKKELIRIVKNDNEFKVDFTGKANGRGAYICDNKECFDKLCKNKLLNKAYKFNVDAKVYQTIGEQYAKHKES